jgi:hypothetical protein
MEYTKGRWNRLYFGNLSEMSAAAVGVAAAQVEGTSIGMARAVTNTVVVGGGVKKVVVITLAVP